MKKLISIILSLVLCFSLVPSCLAANTDQFVFRDGITWGMTEAQVEQHEKSQKIGTIKKDDSVYSIMEYANVEVGSYPAAILDYLFKDGLVYAAFYTLENADDETTEYINGALCSKYGEAGRCGYDVMIKFLKYSYSVLYLTDQGEPLVEMYEKLDVKNFDEFMDNIDRLLEDAGYSKDEVEDEVNALFPGSSWTLPDGTLIVYFDKDVWDFPMIMYFAPEIDQFNTTGL